MAYMNARWCKPDVAFTLVDDQTEDSVVTIEVRVPGGELLFMGEPEDIGRSLILRRTHVESRGIGPNGVGPNNLRLIAEVVMETMDYDEILVEGEIRTTGANPGHRPRLLRFTRGRLP